MGWLFPLVIDVGQWRTWPVIRGQALPLKFSCPCSPRTFAVWGGATTSGLFPRDGDVGQWRTWPVIRGQALPLKCCCAGDGGLLLAVAPPVAAPCTPLCCGGGPSVTGCVSLMRAALTSWKMGSLAVDHPTSLSLHTCFKNVVSGLKATPRSRWLGSVAHSLPASTFIRPSSAPRGELFIPPRSRFLAAPQWFCGGSPFRDGGMVLT